MSSIEANVTVDVPDGVDIETYINFIKSSLSDINGLPTKINVIEVDNPLSLSPISLRKLKV